MVISNQDIVLIAADARRSSICSDWNTLFIDCFVGTQKFALPSFNFPLGNVKRKEVEVALVSNQIEIRLVLDSRNHFYDLFSLLVKDLAEFERS